jgi:hypothetical protein
MPQDYSFRNPVLSLWQASVAEVHRRRQSVRSRMAAVTTGNIVPAAMTKVDDLMAPAHLLAAQVAQSPAPAGILEAAPKTAATGIAATITDAADCAKLAAQFLWAEMSGNQATAKQLAGELKFSVCDATGWAECVTTFLAYKALHTGLPYRPNKDVVVDLGTKSKLAILGDWGTGDPLAINVLQEVAAFKPTWNSKGILGDNGTQYDNCFAIMTLEGAAAKVDYYTVPILKKAARLDVADAVSS